MGTNQRKIPRLAELAVATLAVALERDAPDGAGAFLMEALSFAGPRMRPGEADEIESILRDPSSAAWDDSWLSPQQRASFRRQLEVTLEQLHEMSVRPAGASVSALFQADFVERHQAGGFSENLRELLAEFEVGSEAGAGIQKLMSRLRNWERDRAWVAANFDLDDDHWPWVISSLQRIGLHALGLAVIRHEWALLMCDDCNRYFPSYGRYHHDKRPHCFCSPLCRVRFSRSANRP